MDIQTGGHPRQWNSLQSYEETSYQDFPGGPVIKIPTSNTGDVDLIPGQGTETPCALWQKKKKKKKNMKQKQYCNQFNKDFKKWSTSKKKVF